MGGFFQANGRSSDNGPHSSNFGGMNNGGDVSITYLTSIFSFWISESLMFR